MSKAKLPLYLWQRLVCLLVLVLMLAFWWKGSILVSFLGLPEKSGWPLCLIVLGLIGFPAISSIDWDEIRRRKRDETR
jgi:hypothetical protein